MEWTGGADEVTPSEFLMSASPDLVGGFTPAGGTHLAPRGVAEREVRLTLIEYALFRLLVVHSGKVLTHRQLLTQVWGEKAVGQTHYLRVHVAKLREKLESDPSVPRLILTEPAVGYRLVVK